MRNQLNIIYVVLLALLISGCSLFFPRQPEFVDPREEQYVLSFNAGRVGDCLLSVDFSTRTDPNNVYVLMVTQWGLGACINIPYSIQAQVNSDFVELESYLLTGFDRFAFILPYGHESFRVTSELNRIIEITRVQVVDDD